MTIRYGVNNAAKMVCRTHLQAYPQGEQCPWCPAQVTQHFSCPKCGGSGYFTSVLTGQDVTCYCVGSP